MHPGGRGFVPDEARHCLLDNSVHEVARWLAALDAQVSGTGVPVRFELREPRRSLLCATAPEQRTPAQSRGRTRPEHKPPLHGTSGPHATLTILASLSWCTCLPSAQTAGQMTDEARSRKDMIEPPLRRRRIADPRIQARRAREPLAAADPDGMSRTSCSPRRRDPRSVSVSGGWGP